ncbi:hypothetical protein EJK15_15215 [Nonomuraea basaltis]|nr:hypothetical protein EJK15_15215 [Nonomuraea basaltis]
MFAWNCARGSTRLERAIGVKTNPERGGHVRDVYVRDVTVGQAADAVIEVALNYENKDTGPHFPDVGGHRYSQSACRTGASGRST